MILSVTHVACTGDERGKYCHPLFSLSLSVVSHSHGDVEEDREEELVVDGHGDEPALVELGGGLADHDAQPDAPQKKEKLHWNKNSFL